MTETLSISVLKKIPVLDRKVFQETVEEVIKGWIENEPPSNPLVYLFRTKDRFVAEEVKERGFPVHDKAWEIVKLYRQTNVTKKRVEKVVLKGINGEKLNEEDKAVLIKSQEKLEKYMPIFVNLLAFLKRERIPEEFTVTPTQLAKKKIPLAHVLFKKDLTGKLKDMENMHLPAGAVLFLLTNFDGGDARDKYLVLNSFSLSFLHDDKILRKFPFYDRLENKMQEIIKKESQFYQLKMVAQFFNPEDYILSPFEVYLMLKNNVVIDKLKDKETQKDFLEYYKEQVSQLVQNSPFYELTRKELERNEKNKHTYPRP